MATPTAMKHASQQGRTPSQLAAATPPVSTPFSNPAHAAFSPRGPKSSPQQFKKSPATSSLMAHISNVPLNFDSPSTAAAMGALGITGGLDVNLNNVDVGNLSGLPSLVNEDDKLKRLETIIATLDKKKGLVSEAGLERLAQRIGLDCLSEDTTASDGRKQRTLVIAGSAIQLDIILDNNIVENISLAFPESAASVTKHVGRASEILLKDLQLRPNQSPLTKTLDDFANNLERLAVLDKLSIVPGLDCHEALAGIYASLERLHQWDVAKLREEPGMSDKSDGALSMAAMCTRHGFPVMHSKDRVGLALQYWKILRHIQPTNEQMASFTASREQVWSLLIGCAPIIDEVMPVRVSENWLSKDVIKSEPSINPKQSNLDWQEPDNVVLPPSEENKNAGMEMLQPDLSTARVPQVMFIATFDPPIIMSHNDWTHLYNIVNIKAPQLYGYVPTFDSLLFPIPPGSTQDPSELRAISRQRDVRIYDKNQKPALKPHRNTLYIYKQVYSHRVTEIPFSHPQQLIYMLPLLRQYAFLATLLENSFGSETKEAGPLPKRGDAAVQQPKSNVTTRDELADFMKSASVSDETVTPGSSELKLDVTLWVHPMPHLQVVFPFKNSIANITLKILEDGVVDVAEENVLPHTEDKAQDKRLTRADLGKVLEHMEDLCKWAEWIRTRLT
ncbi:unnamed protein product [Fusarium equiseti]|uniref:Mediator of RNA polymerase II transcription subunit 1 n=1 Tax=Fusarium equiseti TaxID=61235 RepID=A0A8J2ITW6_FUSEQ|nr:unnamed protein product [Fusarium equiseti]